MSKKELDESVVEEISEKEPTEIDALRKENKELHEKFEEVVNAYNALVSRYQKLTVLYNTIVGTFVNGEDKN